MFIKAYTYGMEINSIKMKLVNKLTTKMKKSETNCLQMTRNSV